jgi:hypothetical protein
MSYLPLLIRGDIRTHVSPDIDGNSRLACKRLPADSALPKATILNDDLMCVERRSKRMGWPRGW